jgi:hypothetical protein
MCTILLVASMTDRTAGNSDSDVDEQIFNYLAASLSSKQELPPPTVRAEPSALSRWLDDEKRPGFWDEFWKQENNARAFSGFLQKLEPCFETTIYAQVHPGPSTIDSNEIQQDLGNCANISFQVDLHSEPSTIDSDEMTINSTTHQPEFLSLADFANEQDDHILW